MTRYLVKRLAALVALAIGVSIVCFSLVRLIPGDPARVLLGTSGGDQALLDSLTRELGLDKPITTQYFVWIGHVLRGDFGYSYSQQRPVSQMIGDNIVPTLQLTLAGLTITIAGGILLGVVAAVKRNSAVDTTLMAFAVTFLSIPAFWLGLLLLVLFAVQIPIFDVIGGTSFKGLILPAVTLGLGGIGLTSRFVRSSVIESGRQLYVTTARAKGISELAVLTRHTVRNALLPVLTIVGLQVGSLLSGAVIVEIVFSRPGLGRLLVDAILAKDYSTVQAVILLVAIIYSLVNLAVDLLYSVLDPRIVAE